MLLHVDLDETNCVKVTRHNILTRILVRKLFPSEVHERLEEVFVRPAHLHINIDRAFLFDSVWNLRAAQVELSLFRQNLLNKIKALFDRVRWRLWQNLSRLNHLDKWLVQKLMIWHDADFALVKQISNDEKAVLAGPE